MTAPADLSSLRPATARFLDLLTGATTTGDGTVLGESFADTFLAGDIDGSTITVSREAFVAALPARAAAVGAAGIGAATLVEAREQPLGGAYWLLSTRWSAPRADAEDLVMASTFLLAETSHGTRAVAYLTHKGLPHRLPQP